MGKIIALGGGEIGRPHENGGFYPVETTSIDKEIIKQTGKSNPKLLFIPTASKDSEEYFQVVKKHFSELGCKVDVLYLIKDKFSKKQIEDKILSTDIIYVGGANTLKMMTLWRKIGVDNILKKAHKKGVVLSGLSAGSICWFNCGNSDSRKFTSGSNKLIKVTGLGLIDALHCPHNPEDSIKTVPIEYTPNLLNSFFEYHNRKLPFIIVTTPARQKDTIYGIKIPRTHILHGEYGHKNDLLAIVNSLK